MTDAIRDRIASFERELLERCSDRVEATAFGTAYLHLGFPLRWSSNLVRVERSLDGIDADALAADADRALGEHDAIAHRRIEIHDEVNGPRLASAFLELGWSVERDVFMVRARESERRPTVDVVETDFASSRPLIEAIMRDQPGAGSDEVIGQLVAFRGVLEREAGARFFVARADGRGAAMCEGYRLGDVAQVEDVNTLEAFRGRGLASAVVLAATAWGLRGGARVVFLVADDEDWPKELYRRLGFDEAFRTWGLTRTP